MAQREASPYITAETIQNKQEQGSVVMLSPQNRAHLILIQIESNIPTRQSTEEARYWKRSSTEQNETQTNCSDINISENFLHIATPNAGRSRSTG